MSFTACRFKKLRQEPYSIKSRLYFRTTKYSGNTHLSFVAILIFVEGVVCYNISLTAWGSEITIKENLMKNYLQVKERDMCKKKQKNSLYFTHAFHMMPKSRNFSIQIPGRSSNVLFFASLNLNVQSVSKKTAKQ